MNDKADESQYELAQKARQGDQQALSTLIEGNRARLFAPAYSELRNYADAQDAVAAALCAHRGERAEALELLRQGRARTRSLEAYRADFAELPEFEGVQDAPDFLEAVLGAGR